MNKNTKTPEAKRVCRNCKFMRKQTTYIPFESTENTCFHDDMLWTKDIDANVCRYFVKKQFAVYEKEPAHGKDKNGVILAPYNTKVEAENAGKKYGYYGDNYYVDEI